jgi:hypothetical protein
MVLAGGPSSASLPSRGSPRTHWGTTSIPEVVPKVVLCCYWSGDINQGGEMEVLSRELDALNPPEFAVDGIGHDRGTGHPERVPGIVQLLLVESSIPRRAEGAGGVEVASISRRGARFGEPLPFGKQPLQRLHHRRV